MKQRHFPNYRGLSSSLPSTWVYPITKIVKVLDGDTIRLLIDRGFRDYKQLDVRLYGIDCPEVKGVNKQAGLKAKEFAASWLRDAFEPESYPSQPLLECVKWEDKYGRLLGRIWRGDREELTGSLLSASLALPMLDRACK